MYCNGLPLIIGPAANNPLHAAVTRAACKYSYHDYNKTADNTCTNGKTTSNDHKIAVNVATTVCSVVLVLSPSMITPAMTRWVGLQWDTMHLPSKAAVARLNIINATAVAVLPFSTLR